MSYLTLALCAGIGLVMMRRLPYLHRAADTGTKERPLVHWGHLTVAVILFPLFFLYWIFLSLGEMLSCAVHAALGLLAIAFAFFAGLAGGTPRGAWRAGKAQLERAGHALLRVVAGFFVCFGCEGLVEHVKRKYGPPPPTVSRVASPRTTVGFPFEDRYRIESRLGTGGSTARLFVVRRVAANRPVGDRLVLKYFDLERGSRLEEVVRESRGMQVAKDLGIVLDHRLERDHFYYVMPYYEGETLTRAAARMHRGLEEGEGLGPAEARICLGWMAEILRTLDGYHRRGVIHKDVKPDNVIVTEAGLRLVDLGLLTPVISALTLTTHGTEYFRDPEMVKLSLEGKRVRDVDAVRFDVYSAGAVLYLLFEGSFPSCGPLSRFSRPVPMVVSWITSRAMAEGDKRYPTVAAMRADLETVLALSETEDLARVPASRLPSFRGFDAAPGVGPPPPPPLATVPVEAGPVRESSPAGRKNSTAGRKNPWATFSLLLVTAGLVLGVVFLVRHFRDLKAPPEAPRWESVPVQGVAPPLTARLVSMRFAKWRSEIPAALYPVRGFRVVLVPGDAGPISRVAAEARRRLAAQGLEVAHGTEEASRWLEILREVGTPEARGDRMRTALAEDDHARTFVVWLARVDDGLAGGVDPIVAIRGYYRSLAFEFLAQLPEDAEGGGG
jgi:serine/threonine protein kinase